MVTWEESLENFKAKTDDLIASKYILAEKKISEVLKAIAGSHLLYSLFAHVTDKFDYPTFKSVCFVKNETGKGCFSLPAKDEDVLALVMKLLLDIDGKKTDLIKLLGDYFPAENKQRSFSTFITQVIIPFQLKTEKCAYMLINSLKEEENPDETIGEEVVLNDEEKPEERVREVLKEEDPFEKEREKRRNEAKMFLIGEKNMVSVNTRLGEDERDEISFIIDCLVNALSSGDANGIALGYLALRYADKIFRKSGLDIKGTSEMISRVDI